MTLAEALADGPPYVAPAAAAPAAAPLVVRPPMPPTPARFAGNCFHGPVPSGVSSTAARNLSIAPSGNAPQISAAGLSSARSDGSRPPPGGVNHPNWPFRNTGHMTKSTLDHLDLKIILSHNTCKFTNRAKYDVKLHTPNPFKFEFRQGPSTTGYSNRM